MRSVAPAVWNNKLVLICVSSVQMVSLELAPHVRGNAVRVRHANRYPSLGQVRGKALVCLVGANVTRKVNRQQLGVNGAPLEFKCRAWRYIERC